MDIEMERPNKARRKKEVCSSIEVRRQVQIKYVKLCLECMRTETGIGKMKSWETHLKEFQFSTEKSSHTLCVANGGVEVKIAHVD